MKGKVRGKTKGYTITTQIITYKQWRPNKRKTTSSKGSKYKPRIYIN